MSCAAGPIISGLPCACKHTFARLAHRVWWRVAHWQRTSHRWGWKDFRRRFTTPRWKWKPLSADGITVLNLEAVPVRRRTRDLLQRGRRADSPRVGTGL